VLYPALRMAVDTDLISALLREHLSPWQEKVVRLYFGLGCAESFKAAERRTGEWPPVILP